MQHYGTGRPNTAPIGISNLPATGEALFARMTSIDLPTLNSASSESVEFDDSEHFPEVFLGAFPEVDLTDEYFNEEKQSGLDTNALKHLPVFTNTREHDHVCCICLAQIKSNQNISRLPKCAHTFHSRCIKAWLQCQNVCPLCKGTVMIKKTASSIADVEARESAMSFASRLGWRT